MVDISIKQSHRLSPGKAKAAAQKIADQMAEDFDVTSEWTGDVLRFNRIGVSGSLQISETDATLEITLGFLLKAFAPAIEQKVAAKMERVFAANV